jgi:hypothetical protein
VEPSDLGAASSTVNFFRSLGSAVGVSALGAVLSHRITDYIKEGASALDPEYASALTGSSTSSSIPDVDSLPGPVRSLVESAYGHGIADVFHYVSPFALLALAVCLFIKEVPLRTKGGLAQAAEDKAGAGAGTGAEAGTPAPAASAPAPTPGAGRGRRSGRRRNCAARSSP